MTKNIKINFTSQHKKNIKKNTSSHTQDIRNKPNPRNLPQKSMLFTLILLSNVAWVSPGHGMDDDITIHINAVKKWAKAYDAHRNQPPGRRTYLTRGWADTRHTFRETLETLYSKAQELSSQVKTCVTQNNPCLNEKGTLPIGNEDEIVTIIDAVKKWEKAYDGHRKQPPGRGTYLTRGWADTRHALTESLERLYSKAQELSSQVKTCVIQTNQCTKENDAPTTNYGIMNDNLRENVNAEFNDQSNHTKTIEGPPELQCNHTNALETTEELGLQDQNSNQSQNLFYHQQEQNPQNGTFTNQTKQLDLNLATCKKKSETCETNQQSCIDDHQAEQNEIESKQHRNLTHSSTSEPTGATAWSWLEESFPYALSKGGLFLSGFKSGVEYSLVSTLAKEVAPNDADNVEKLFRLGIPLCIAYNTGSPMPLVALMGPAVEYGLKQPSLKASAISVGVGVFCESIFGAKSVFETILDCGLSVIGSVIGSVTVTVGPSGIYDFCKSTVHTAKDRFCDFFSAKIHAVKDRIYGHAVPAAPAVAPGPAPDGGAPGGNGRSGPNDNLNDDSESDSSGSICGHLAGDYIISSLEAHPSVSANTMPSSLGDDRSSASTVQQEQPSYSVVSNQMAGTRLVLRLHAGTKENNHEHPSLPQ